MHKKARRNRMLQQTELAGSLTLPGADMRVNRMGYGAMQLAGRDGNKLVWGPPRNIDEAVAVLQEAVESGVNHIDTADFYGPHVTNQIIRKALSPYPKDLVIVTKVSAQLADVCFRCLPSERHARPTGTTTATCQAEAERQT